jgi:hypothetical protein
MNTVGKTLVIINLVFALLVAGFLVIDFATRTNWKNEFDKLKVELDMSRVNTRTAQDTNVKLLDSNKNAQASLNLLEMKSNRAEDEATKKIEAANFLAQREADKAKNAELLRLKILSENGRLHEEIKDLTNTLKKREEAYLALQKAANNYRQEAVAKEEDAKAANARSLILLDQLRQKELQLVKLEALGKGVTAATSVVSRRSLDYRNPPPAYVKGVVETVSRDDATVGQISIGSDAGLKEDQTLEVYRVRPRPEYVGTMRLKDVKHHTALGQLIRPFGMGQGATLKQGDEVASKILR